MIETVKTYYWIVADGYILLEVNIPRDTISIFEFAWMKPALT